MHRPYTGCIYQFLDDFSFVLSHVTHDAITCIMATPPLVPTKTSIILQFATLHVFKLNKVSPKEFRFRHTQATVSRSRLPSQKLPHCARRAIHPHAPPPLSNTVRIRMELLPRLLSVIMGEESCYCRCNPIV